MTEDFATSELRELQLDYLRDTHEKVQLIHEHGRRLAVKRHFKTSFPLLLFLSHQLKGSGGSLGFPEISSIASRMNQELNRFLESDSDPRVSPQRLSATVLELAGQLEAAVGEAQAQVAQ